ncbi:hypothetical protein DL765_005968 [Monosporascus sp. GIB2]|nr:hypothetical protein DL765_005968 [Monosporascus sp. GIB2]
MMKSSDFYNTNAGAEEHILDLENGRQLAYAYNGPLTSRTVVLFFSGLMSVGNAAYVPEPCSDLQVLWIAPTLPGMGNSSIRSTGDEYHVALARDITVLLSHLYPTGAFDTLYIGGGSYGTVPAQMLYGASYDLFPAGRKTAACLLLSGFSPFKYHVGYARTLSWHTWFSVGPPSQLPFRPVQRLTSTILATKLRDQDGAKAFLDQVIFSKMDEEEQAVMAAWLERKGRTRDEFIGQMAEAAIKCCKRWDGFMEVADVIHSDWGFDPAKLDDEHTSKPVLVCGSEKDGMGGATNAWIVENYKCSKLWVVPGGHISGLFYLDEIWEEVFKMSRPSGR